LVLRFAALAAIAAAAAMAVVAAGYALFAVLEGPIGPAGAAAVVAVTAAVLALLAALVLFRQGRTGRETNSHSMGLTEHLVDIARDRPIAVAALAVAAGWILVRNPALANLAAGLMSSGSRRGRRW
jgi:hypothetical protein